MQLSKFWNLSEINVKGVSSKPSGDCIVAPNFCFLSFKFWLLAYFFILFDCAKIQKDWTTFILDILQDDVFCFCNLPKIQRGDPCKMYNITVVQSF